MTGRHPAEFGRWPSLIAAPYGPYRAVVKHHVDGDTFDMFVDLGLNTYRYLTIRLLGVDTPETNRLISRKDGLAAMGFVMDRMPPNCKVLLHTLPDPDSFGRYLARITLPDGRDLTELIINSGHGLPA